MAMKEKMSTRKLEKVSSTAMHEHYNKRPSLVEIFKPDDSRTTLSSRNTEKEADSFRATQLEVEPVDIEKSAVTSHEHVVMSISGMICTGCSKKGMNILSRIAGALNEKINFVASLGEYDVDLNQAASISEVTSQFERATGFGSSRIISDLQTLDVLMSHSEAHNLQDKLPIGVDAIVGIYKQTWAMSYDLSVIGAHLSLKLFHRNN